jgi:hypothetical protein
MSADPVSGVVGLVTIGSTPVTINKAKTYKFKSARDETEQGPWIGDAQKVVTIGGKLGEIQIEGDVIIAGDAGVQDVVDAYEAGTNDQLVCVTEDGYSITFAAPRYTELAIEGDASAGQTWSFTAKGAYAIAQDS